MRNRQLSSIKEITALHPIEGADRIECATIAGGWKVVVKKGEFQVGEQCLYIEIDAWVPHELAPFLSQGNEPREYRGVKGERLRTVTLRGQISQGLVLNSIYLCDTLFEFKKPILFNNREELKFHDYRYLRDEMEKLGQLENWNGGLYNLENVNWDEQLGIQKWEMPIPARLSGEIKGAFPSFIPKTDQERVQNLDGEIDWDEEYQITVKLDGTSMTLWSDGEEWHLASRNLELKMDQEGNTFVNTAKKVIKELTKNSGNPLKILDGIALQGELIGEGIQGNREDIVGHLFCVFDVFSIKRGYMMNISNATKMVYGIPHAPILHEKVKLSDIGIDSIESALKFADGKSLNNPVREGVVFKRTSGERFTFKAISNEFLLENK